MISNVGANESSTLNLLKQYAQDKQLWTDVEWLNLVHYQKDAWATSGYRSQADDRRFFSAANGKVSPRDELLATINALYRMDNSGDEHAQCRFVARYHWIRKNIAHLTSELPEVDCPEYQKWRARIPDHQVTMIFPTYHLNSPSSMFGHNLLRLDPADSSASSDWLSIAINFGANVDANDNSLFFAFKGLSGGYPGNFIATPYYEKIKEYNQQENRDIWEYPLNLTPEETGKLVAHLWELKDIEFDYYFFDENCSYRLLELLEVARPGIELTDDYYLTAIPIDTIRSIEDANLITGVEYRPSKATVLQDILARIPAANLQLVLRLAENTDQLNSAEFNQLPMRQQRDVIDAAYQYLRYQQTNKPRTAKSAKSSYQLLRALNRFPVTEKYQPPEPAQPESGHLSKRLTISLGNDDEQRYSEFGFRMSFHSLEDNQTGFLQGAQINFASLQVRNTEDGDAQIQQLDLIDIFSLTPRSDFFKPLSWRVKTGLERQMTFARDRLVTHVTGGVGYSYQPIENNFSYALLVFRLEHNRGFDDDISPALGLSLGSLHHFDSSTAIVELGGEHFDNDEYRYRLSYTHNYALSRNHSIKLTALQEQQHHYDYAETGVSYQYYF